MCSRNLLTVPMNIHFFFLKKWLINVYAIYATIMAYMNTKDPITVLQMIN